MLRKLVVLAALAALSIVPAAPAGAEPYTPKIPTQTKIEIISIEGPGKPVVLDLSASANHPTPPEGDIKLSVAVRTPAAGDARAASTQVYSITVHFVNAPVRITIPRLPKGIYAGRADFTPTSSLFLTSADDETLPLDDEVGGVEDDGNDGSDGGESAGGLPNTGGPDITWLLLGGALVAAGAAGVAHGRRRPMLVA